VSVCVGDCISNGIIVCVCVGGDWLGVHARMGTCGSITQNEPPFLAPASATSNGLVYSAVPRARAADKPRTLTSWFPGNALDVAPASRLVADPSHSIGRAAGTSCKCWEVQVQDTAALLKQHTVLICSHAHANEHACMNTHACVLRLTPPCFLFTAERRLPSTNTLPQNHGALARSRHTLCPVVSAHL
jgi:hypothetical protein